MKHITEVVASMKLGRHETLKLKGAVGWALLMASYMAALGL